MYATYQQNCPETELRYIGKMLHDHTINICRSCYSVALKKIMVGGRDRLIMLQNIF